MRKDRPFRQRNRRERGIPQESSKTWQLLDSWYNNSTDYGGSGADFVTSAIATEEIARADISMATAVYYLVEAGWGFLMDR